MNRWGANDVIVWSAAAVLACILLWNARTTRRLKRVLGPSRYGACIATTKWIARHSARIGYLNFATWACAATGALLLCYVLLYDAHPLVALAAVALLVVGLQRSVAARVPAVILVLGASRAEQLSLQAAIRDAVFPFRPVSLLETGDWVDMRVAGDCFRIRQDTDWREAIFALCRSLPLIVVDIRVASQHVEEEIEHVLGEGYAHKTLLIAPLAATTGLRNSRSGMGAKDSESLCALDQPEGIALLRYVLLDREMIPDPQTPLCSLYSALRQTSVPSGQAERPTEESPARWRVIEVRQPKLAPFSYQEPPGWEVKVLAGSADRYAVLLRPPEDRGLRNILRRRSRLDLMVFKYPANMPPDETALRRATDVNLSGRGASITQETTGRRCGAVSHECFFVQGPAKGFVVRFIANASEYVVHWKTTSEAAMRRHIATVQEFVNRVDTTKTP